LERNGHFAGLVRLYLCYTALPAADIDAVVGIFGTWFDNNAVADF
jgi:hypothetical protein